MLSGKQWIELMDAAIEKGMMSALLTGGETLTHPDLWDIYMHLIEKGVQVRLKTNGLLLTKETIAKLNIYQPFMIDVSLYGCNNESYEAVTGKRAFDVIKGNIESIIANQLPLHLKIVPSRYMMPYLKDIMALADQDVLNAVFYGSVYYVDPIGYNFVRVFEPVQRLRKSVDLSKVKIIHYNGASKPWKRDYHGLFAGQFRKYAGRVFDQDICGDSVKKAQRASRRKYLRELSKKECEKL